MHACVYVRPCFYSWPVLLLFGDIFVFQCQNEHTRSDEVCRDERESVVDWFHVLSSVA